MKKKVKLLCWIMADQQHLYTQIIHQKATWGQRCDKLLVMSSKEDATFPAIGLNNTQEGRYHIAFKAKAAWVYIYKHYIDHFDFFIKCDPDTYLVVENLQDFLSDKDPLQPHFYGHMYKWPHWKYPWIAGGPGEILTKTAVKKLVTEAFVKFPKCIPDGNG